MKLIDLVFNILLFGISLAVFLAMTSGVDAWPIIVSYWIVLFAKNFFELMKG